MKMIIEKINQLLEVLSQSQNTVKNILLWNGADIMPTINSLFPNAFCLDIESSSEEYSKALDAIVLAKNDSPKVKMIAEYITINTDLSGETDLREYLFAPSKYPQKFDFIIINNEFQAECLRVAKNYTSNESTILLLSNNPNDLKVPKKFDKVYFELPASEDFLVSISNKKNILEELRTINEIPKLQISRKNNTPNIELFERPALSILFIHKYQEDFLNEVYGELALSSLSYREQLIYLLSKQHLWSDYFSNQFIAMNCRVDNLIINADVLQDTWQRERDFPIDASDIINQQISAFNPDVIFLDLYRDYSSEEIALFRKYAKLIVAYSQHLPNTELLNHLDILFISEDNPQHSNTKCKLVYIPSLFDPRCDSSPSNFELRDEECQALCSYKDEELIALSAEALECKVNVSDYSLIAQEILPNGINSNVYAELLYKMLSNSKIVVASDISKLNKANPEVTMENLLACGGALITEYSQEINERFDIGKELLCYRSPREAILLGKYLKENPNDCEKIAKLGSKIINKHKTYEAFSANMLKEIEKVFIS